MPVSSAQPAFQSLSDMMAHYNLPLDQRFLKEFWQYVTKYEKAFYPPMRRKYQELGEYVHPDTPTGDNDMLRARFHETVASMVKREEYWAIDSLHAWLWTAIVRDIINEVNTKRNRRELELEHAQNRVTYLPEKGADGKHTLQPVQPVEAYVPDRSDTHEAMRRAIASLPRDDYRQVLTAALQVDSVRPGPIAEYLGRSHGWVARRLDPALDQVGLWLAAHREVDPTIYFKTAANLKYRQVYEAAEPFNTGRGEQTDATKARQAKAGEWKLRTTPETGSRHRGI
jgi:DNA-directed RNA polymerase specialized sigma24 family protein